MWYTENDIVLCGEVSQIMTSDVFPPPYLDLSERCTIVGSPGHSELIINNPRVEDSGQYTCMAENGIITADEVSVYLQVNGRLNTWIFREFVGSSICYCCVLSHTTAASTPPNNMQLTPKL